MPRHRIAGILFVLAGILVVVSGFLDWATVSYQGQDVGKIVGRSVNYGTGAVLAIVGAIIVARGWFARASLVLWVLAVLNAIWTLLLFSALQQSANDLVSSVIPNATASYSIAPGFIVLILGAVAALAGAVAGTRAGASTPGAVSAAA